VSLAVKKKFITYFRDEENYLLKLIQFFYQAMNQRDLVSKLKNFDFLAFCGNKFLI